MNSRIVLILISATLLGTLSVASAQAGTYRSPTYPYEYGYKVGDCILVDTPSEADATHVYTLNPNFTRQMNTAYMRYFGRNARCDELQFHN